MQETILSRLEASRKELLDLGLRNLLLHYKMPKSRGLHIVNEKSAALFNILVRQGKTMSFLAKPGREAEQGQLDFAELPQPEQEAAWKRWCGSLSLLSLQRQYL